MNKRHSVQNTCKFITIFFTCFAFWMSSTALADSDILFRGIPWLTNEKHVLETIIKDGINTEDTDFDSIRRDLIQSWSPFEGCEYPNGVEGTYTSILCYDRVPQTDWFIRGPFKNVSGKRAPVCQVAGHDVETIRIYFLPKAKVQSDGTKAIDMSDLQFVRAGYNISDLHYGKDEEVYQDLLGKLTSLYGEPVESDQFSSYWHSMDTGIYLWRAVSSSGSVFIDYAFIADEEMVEELNQIQHSIDDATNEATKNSTDGL